ncbi:MAG: L-rhamnose/proton symporter RhaT [Verrucomicrobiota bacterium]|jgi:L-rhamnose-H+ transport protein
MNEPAAMTANPALGILIFVLGGLAGAVFYLPLKKVKNWAWESYWLFWALFALLIVPWALALIKSPNTFSVLKAAPGKELLYCYLCGAAWGFGGLTWGLMIRYLGVGLGLAMGCGLCSAAGTIVPKILKGDFGQLFQSDAGKVSFVGVLVSLLGIVLVGLAGMSKEKELPEEEKKKAVAEYNFGKGMLVALFSGLMSAALNFGLQGGGTIEKLALTTPPQTSEIWKGMPVLVIALLGGFTVNFLWCLFLNAKNKTFGDYSKKDAPIVPNIIFGAIAGAIWVCQFIAFKTGEPRMGDQSYVGWAVLMASSIMFSGVLGLLLGEWKGTSSKTRTLLGFGLAVLLGSSVLSGYSGKLGQDEAKQAAPPAATAPAAK